MAISYNDTQRTSRMTDISDAVDAGTAAGYLRIYSGTRPSNGAAVGTGHTLLAELRFSDPCVTASGVATGVLTFDSITADTSANAAGTASWFRILQSNGTTYVADGSVSVTGGGGDLQLDSTTIASGQNVSVNTFTITEGNDYTA
jgi:hypothetical protein